MDVKLFDFVLPQERIALRPAEPRDSARMLVMAGKDALRDAYVQDLAGFRRGRDRHSRGTG